MTIGCNHYFMYLTVKFIFTQQARDSFFAFVLSELLNVAHLHYKGIHKISSTAGSK